MSDIHIRTEGRAGRITLTRPEALNAVSHQMCLAIEAALDAWRDDDAVRLVIVDAEGDRAFSAGGDLVTLYETGRAGDYAHGRTFWRDEYRMNAKVALYPKPYVALMQGYDMGGGVGISCHGTHRIAGETSQIAMPECGIGLVPDVGGSLLLARAPGRLGAYLGLTGARMRAGDAILAGFADHFVPQAHWPDLIRDLERSGDAGLCAAAAVPPPPGTLRDLAPQIDALFGPETLAGILTALRASETEFAARTLATLARNAPLAMACTLEILRRLRGGTADIHMALDLEYRFTARAMEQGDFLEGIRAQVIDKDRRPRWADALEDDPGAAVERMLRPLGTGAAETDRTDIR